MKIRLRGLLLLGLAWPALASAYTEGMAYMKVPQGARSSGMAGAMVAMHGGAESMWYNPAGIEGSSLFEASFSRMAWIGDTHNDYLAMSLRLSPRHSLGIYGNWLSSGDTYRDSQGNEGGGFSDSASVIGLAWGVDWGVFGLGVGIKRASESFDGTVNQAYALDAGIQLNVVQDRLRLGLAAQNFGGYSGNNYNSSSYSYSSYGEGAYVYAPATIRVGAVLENVISGFLVSAEYRDLPFSYENTLSAGAEYAFKAGPIGLALRGGYEQAAARLGDWGGISVGGGFRMDSLQADYAWIPEGALGNPYRLTMTWLYGSPPQPKKAEPRPARARTYEVEGESARADAAGDTPSPHAAEAAASPASDFSNTAELLETAHDKEDAGNYSQALEIYQKLCMEAPGEVSFWKAVARVEAKLKHMGAARRAYQKVMELKPNDEAKRWLDRHPDE